MTVFVLLIIVIICFSGTSKILLVGIGASLAVLLAAGAQFSLTGKGQGFLLLCFSFLFGIYSFICSFYIKTDEMFDHLFA